MKEAYAAVEARPCSCVPCDFCHGQGTYWANIRTGMPSDDCSHLLDELEACEECHGGIIEMCDRCRELEELAQLIEEQESPA